MDEEKLIISVWKLMSFGDIHKKNKHWRNMVMIEVAEKLSLSYGGGRDAVTAQRLNAYGRTEYYL